MNRISPLGRPRVRRIPGCAEDCETVERDARQVGEHGDRESFSLPVARRYDSDPAIVARTPLFVDDQAKTMRVADRERPSIPPGPSSLAPMALSALDAAPVSTVKRAPRRDILTVLTSQGARGARFGAFAISFGSVVVAATMCIFMGPSAPPSPAHAAAAPLPVQTIVVTPSNGEPLIARESAHVVRPGIPAAAKIGERGFGGTRLR